PLDRAPWPRAAPAPGGHVSPRPAATPTPTREVRGTTSHAREMNKFFFVKLVLMALVNAFGLFVLYSSWQVGHWGMLAAMVVLLVVVNWAYFSKRMRAAKFLVPGLVFLCVYQLFTMAYTGYVAFTNYGTGHIGTKEAAIEANLAQNEHRVEGTPAYPLAVVSSDDEELGFAILDDGAVLVGTADSPFQPAPEATVADGAITAVPGYEVLTFEEILQQQEEITTLRVGFG